jgi:hemoglobin
LHSDVPVNGKDLKTAHAGMGVQASHFDALGRASCWDPRQLKVAAADKVALLDVLGPMQGDIVAH